MTRNRAAEFADAKLRIGTKEYSRGEISRGAGISISHVSRIFGGARTPSLETMEKIAKYTGEDIAVVISAIKANAKRRLQDKYGIKPLPSE